MFWRAMTAPSRPTPGKPNCRTSVQYSSNKSGRLPSNWRNPLYQHLKFFGLIMVVCTAMNGAKAATYSTFLNSIPPCGTVENKHVCVTLSQADDNNEDVRVVVQRLPDATRGQTIATWSGNIACSMLSQKLAPGQFQAWMQVHLELQDRTNDPVDVGGEGSGGAGFLVGQKTIFSHTEMTPITLTWLFKGSISHLVVLARASFISGENGSCTISGGSFTTTTVVKN